MDIWTLYVAVVWIALGTVMLMAPWVLMPMLIAFGVFLTVLAGKFRRL